jgi:hypothetical protein
MLDTSGGNIPEYIKISSPRTLSIKVIIINIYDIAACKTGFPSDYLAARTRNFSFSLSSKGSRISLAKSS